MTDTKKAYPTDEAVAAVVAERKLNRIGAVQYLRRQSAKAAQPKATKEHNAPKATKQRKAVKPSDKAPITAELSPTAPRRLAQTVFVRTTSRSRGRRDLPLH